MAYETTGTVTRIQPGYGVSVGYLKVQFTDDKGNTQQTDVECGNQWDSYQVGGSVRIQKSLLGWKLKGGADSSDSLKRFWDRG